MTEDSKRAETDQANLPGSPPRSMLHLFDAANGVTLVSLICALTCCGLAFDQRIAWALVALMACGLCDLFDGFVARRMNRSSLHRAFGAQLDSLVDACAFGMAPAMLLYATGLRHPLESVLLAGLPLCVVWRLAWYNTLPMTEIDGRRYFAGLPSTYVALFLPLTYLVGLWQRDWLRPCLILAALLLMLAMISTRPIRKPGGLAYLFFLLLAVTVAFLFIRYGEALAPLPVN